MKHVISLCLALPSGIFGVFNEWGSDWKWHTTMNGGSGAILGYKSISWTGSETTDSCWIMGNWGGPEESVRSKRIPNDASRIDRAGRTGKVNFVVCLLGPSHTTTRVKMD